ncbi:MAG TPA: NAD-dependent succinate-semialdehyde dehydrogenase, partial [Gemmatimonadaceae bacterium]|nr:NAD-dependent succinate-semialdehyde dehydrogenase [Gemmatimonadaceae bacterium]
MGIASINPATGAQLRAFDELSAEAMESKIALAAGTFAVVQRTSFADRARWLLRAAELLESEKAELGRLMTLEMGKPIAAAREEAAKCAWVCRYYAEHAERILGERRVPTDARDSYVMYQPMGVVLAIMPWNFPFWQVFRFAAPALMAGNVALLKHASNVPQCALAIEDLLLRSGAPAGVFQALLIGSSRVAPLLRDPRIAAVTLTGSEGAGRSVGKEAGESLKKSVLELGGSDAFVVMPSAHLAVAARTAVKARTINNGQSCIAAKRFIVHDAVADEFERRFVAGMEALRVGDPMDEHTDIGPLATADILRDVDQQVRSSVAAGATVLTGGRRLGGTGNYYAPTALTAVPPEAPAYREEVFGPVATLFRVRDATAAIALANDTTFGLGASAWTNDAAEQERFVRELQAGLVFVNGMVASDPRLPFGGVKHSGYGRELSEEGIREFVNVKTVVIQAPGGDKGTDT